MTLDEILEMVLQNGSVGISYEIFADLFPPGIDDDPARERAGNFARQHNLEIERNDTDQSVTFTRNA